MFSMSIIIIYTCGEISNHYFAHSVTYGEISDHYFAHSRTLSHLVTLHWVWGKCIMSACTCHNVESCYAEKPVWGGVAGEVPHVYVFLQFVPAQGGIESSCLVKQLVVTQTLGGRVLRKQHGHRGLVFSQLQCQPWVRGQACAQVSIPRLGPGCEIGHQALVPGPACVGPAGCGPRHGGTV